eukprot:18154-Heterococcus_DN1.PRE.5
MQLQVACLASNIRSRIDISQCRSLSLALECYADQSASQSGVEVPPIFTGTRPTVSASTELLLQFCTSFAILSVMRSLSWQLFRAMAKYKPRAVLRAYAAIQVGQDLQSVRAFSSSSSKHSKPELVHFREIGGAMAAMWSAYFDRCSCLLYVVDAAAEPQQLAAACELLFQQLLHSGLNSKRVVVCLNKTDLCSSDAIERAVACLKLDEVPLWAGHSVQVVQASALTGNNVLAVLRAVQQQQPAVAAAYSATKAAGCVPQTTASKQQLQLPALVPKTQATCAAR